MDPDVHQARPRSEVKHVDSALCGCAACSEIAVLEWEDTIQGLQARYTWTELRPPVFVLEDKADAGGPLSG